MCVCDVSCVSRAAPDTPCGCDACPQGEGGHAGHLEELLPCDQGAGGTRHLRVIVSRRGACACCLPAWLAGWLPDWLGAVSVCVHLQAGSHTGPVGTCLSRWHGRGAGDGKVVEGGRVGVGAAGARTQGTHQPATLHLCLGHEPPLPLCAPHVLHSIPPSLPQPAQCVQGHQA